MATMPDFLEVCRRGVKEAGAILLDRIGRVRVQSKGRGDLVTEADFASQAWIRRMIQEAFPTHVVLGEEDQAEMSVQPGESAYRWIVDPLDGTTNYVHQVPHFSVSLALEHQGELLVGAVYNPVADECFTAEAGQGAFLNDRPIQASQVTTLCDALAAVGFPSVVTPASPDLKLFLAAVEVCQAIRRTGSAALNLCYVAAGRFDASWAYSTKIWDIAAGMLIVREAGGVVSTPGSVVDAPLQGPYLAAANPRLHAQLRAVAARAGL